MWAVLDRASAGWRGFTMTPAGLRLLQDLRRSLHDPPTRLPQRNSESHRNRRGTNRFRSHRIESQIANERNPRQALLHRSWDATPAAPPPLSDFASLFENIESLLFVGAVLSRIDPDDIEQNLMGIDQRGVDGVWVLVEAG